MQAEQRRVKLIDRLGKSATTGTKSPIVMDDEVNDVGVQVRGISRLTTRLKGVAEGSTSPIFSRSMTAAPRHPAPDYSTD